MPKPDSDIIERYLTNRCSAEEAKVVLAWFATREGQAFYDRYLTRRMKEQPMADEAQDHEKQQKTLEGVYARIQQQERFRPRITHRRYRIAATIALLLMGTWATRYWIQSQPQVVETAFGETERIILDDGSQVVLNANSKLWYQSNKPREIWLKGEAFFDVTHTPESADFKVHTADLTINVLGTEFNVNTHRKKTDVVLSDGQVKLELERNLKKESLIMHPGDRISFSHQKNALERKVVQPQAYTSWINGTIIFDHTPLSEIFQRLEDTYGVKIEAEDSLIAEREFTGEVLQDLEIIVTLIEKSFDLNAYREGNTIYLN